MKARSILSVVFLVLFAARGESQTSHYDWHPFPNIEGGERFDYTLGNDPVPRYRQAVDSILLDGTDTTWLLRFFPFPCDTCPLTTVSGSENSIHFPGLPLFGADRWRKIGLNTYRFEGGRTFELHPRKRPGEFWLFQPSTPIHALVDAAYDSLLFGTTMDSVKRVLLSSGDTLQLSKNHGILRFPYSLGNGDSTPYRLSGLSKKGLGNPMPTWREIFRIEPGTVLAYHYREAYNMGGVPLDWYDVFRVIDLEETAYQNIMTIEGARKFVHNRSSFPGTTYHYGRISGTLIADSVYYRMNVSCTTPYMSGIQWEDYHGLSLGEPYEYWLNWLWMPSLYDPFYFIWQLHLNEQHRMEVSSIGVVSEDHDLWPHSYDSIEYAELSELGAGRRYSPGLGIVYRLDFAGKKIVWIKNLIGYTTLTDTFGTIPDTLDWPLGMATLPIAEAITAFPSPSSGIVRLPSWTTPSQVSVHNSMGQVVLEQLFHPGTPLDLSHLPNGLYWIELRNKDKRGIARVSILKP